MTMGTLVVGIVHLGWNLITNDFGSAICWLEYKGSSINAESFSGLGSGCSNENEAIVKDITKVSTTRLAPQLSST